MSGIRLIDRLPCDVKPHVHASTPTWTLTSDHPVESVPDDVDVLNQPLPGRLGWYVLPHDVVFSLTKGDDAHWRDFERVMCEERLAVVERHRLNHLTAEQHEDADDVEEDDEEDEEEEEEDEEVDAEVGEGSECDDDDV